MKPPDDLCPHCGATAGYEQREKPPHVGLYCRACGRWVKWLRQDNAQATPAPEAQSQEPKDSRHLAQESCNHSAELDRVVHALNGVERQLTIIVRAMLHQDIRGANE